MQTGAGAADTGCERGRDGAAHRHPTGPAMSPAEPLPRARRRAALASVAVAAGLAVGAATLAAGPESGAGPDTAADAGADAGADAPSPTHAPRPDRAAPPAVPERPVGKRTLELMRLAGIDDEVERLAADLVAALVDGFASADPSGSPERVRLAGIVGARLFSVERVHDAVARRVETMLPPEARERLIEHHGSALGRRVLDVETARGPTAGPDVVKRFAEAARREPGHEARLARFASLMAETDADRLVARLSSDLRLAAMHGALVADPATFGPSFDADVADLEWQRGIVRFMLARELPTLLAHTYAELSDADVEALLEASRGGDQRRLLKALRTGVHDAVLAAGEGFGPGYRGALRRAELPGDAL